MATYFPEESLVRDLAERLLEIHIDSSQISSTHMLIDFLKELQHGCEPWLHLPKSF